MGIFKGSVPKEFIIKLVQIGDRLEEIEYLFGGLAVVVFFLSVCINVITRELPFLKSVIWAEDVARFGYIWAVFLGSGIVMRYGKHFTIDFLLNLCGKKFTKVLNFFQSIVTLCFAVIISYSGICFSIMSIERASIPSNIPMIYANICIPLGMAVIAYFMLEHLILMFNGTSVVQVQEIIKESSQ